LCHVFIYLSSKYISVADPKSILCFHKISVYELWYLLQTNYVKCFSVDVINKGRDWVQHKPYSDIEFNKTCFQPNTICFYVLCVHVRACVQMCTRACAKKWNRCIIITWHMSDFWSYYWLITHSFARYLLDCIAIYRKDFSSFYGITLFLFRKIENGQQIIFHWNKIVTNHSSYIYVSWLMIFDFIFRINVAYGSLFLLPIFMLVLTLFSTLELQK
jgi:hypothetical protein